MKMSNGRMLSEVIKYYEDFDGDLEESLFNWLIERVKKAERYEVTLKEIALDNGTPYANIAKEALKD